MPDPLAVAGVALGTSSLTIQVVDECIKWYKFFSEASEMPENHRFLQIRLQMEQQRFLIFAKETGLLSADNDLSEALSINPALFTNILVEIRILFEKFEQFNRKYIKIVPSDELVNPASMQTSMMDLLCTTEAIISQIDISAASPSSVSSKPDMFVKKTKNKSQRLRTIIAEPRRLVWVSFDQTDFEAFIAKLEGFNSFLISLLDRSSFRQLDKSIKADYLEILQMKPDIRGLEATIKALTLDLQQQNVMQSVATPLGDFIPQATAPEIQSNIKRMQYMKQLADIKLHRLDIDRSDASNNAMTDDDKSFAGLNVTNSLALHDLPGPRQIISVGDDFVWLESIDSSHILDNTIDNNLSKVEHRVRLLAKLLSVALPEDFRTPPCYGYVKLQNGSGPSQQPQFSLALNLPKNTTNQKPRIFSLRGLLVSQPAPSLSLRVSLCCKIAECLGNFHAVDWLHKNLRSQNILFFSTDQNHVDFREPYLTGLQLSRPSGRPELTDKAKVNPEADIYRHPLVQGGENAGAYRKSYDLYSLGVILIEIACWSPIERILGFHSLQGLTGAQLRSIKEMIIIDNDPVPSMNGEEEQSSPTRSIYLQQVAVHCGDAFRNAVELLLCMSEMENPSYPGEKLVARNRRLRDAFVEGVLERLQTLRESV